MAIRDDFVNYVREYTEKNPENAWGRVMLGFYANSFLKKVKPDKSIASGYNKLEVMLLSYVNKALKDRKNYVWANIFAPCEIFESMGLSTLSMECLGSFLGGYQLEAFFIDHSQSLEIAPTLCSYHQNMIGAVNTGVLPLAQYAVTTSLACDGNLNTFRYFESTKGVPFSLIDIPYVNDEASVEYVKLQLKEMIADIEKHTGRRFDENQLKDIIRIENETIDELKRFFLNLQKHYYPGHIIHQLYLIMGAHLLMGTEGFLGLIRDMNREIVTYPEFKGKRIMWVHLIPYYQETLKEYFNGSEDYQLFASDMIMDNYRKLDPEDPLGSVARKLIGNVFNGPYDNKADYLTDMVKELKPDGVIHFCHWGCKQADGGSVLLKERMKELDVPMLILDGDGIDRRNSHDGQIRTRLEAFLEMLEEGK